MTSATAISAPADVPSTRRYRLPGIQREGIAQLSLLETALWPLKGGVRDTPTFETSYTFRSDERAQNANVKVYAPLGLYSTDEYILWGLLGMSLSRKDADPVLLASPHWIIRKLGMSVGGFQYDQLRDSLERLAVVAYQNTAFYNPLTQQHERVTLHFFSAYLPTRGRGGPVDTDRVWKIEWSPTFFQMCRATGGTLLFDLDVYRALTPAARRLFLKLKDRFWRTKRVFLNVDDLTIDGLGFSADRPLKKRKYDLTACITELLEQGIIELGRGHSEPKDLFLKRGKGLYVVQFFEGPYFRRPLSERMVVNRESLRQDPLYEPLRTIGVDEPGIRRILRNFSRGAIQRWVRITDAAQHENPRGFPGFKVSPAAFLIDGLQNGRMPPDWLHVHEKERERASYERLREIREAEEVTRRTAYDAERAAAIDAHLATPAGKARLTTYEAAFREFYRTVDPHQYIAAAREAAVRKIEREEVQFPEFGVWLLNQ